MPPERTITAIARRIRDILERGLDLSPEVIRFIDSTFSNPSVDELAAVLCDESNSERDSLLELLFSPDDAVYLDLEELLLLPSVAGVDPNPLAEILCRPPLWVGFRLPDGQGCLKAEMTPPLARRFVRQLRLDRRIPDPVAAAINARPVYQQRLRLRVLMRHARLDVLPHQVGFLCTLVERLGLEDDADWECFAFVLELLAGTEPAADIYTALVERKKLLIRALNQGRRQREHLAAANFEMLLSRGQRLTSVDEAARQRQMEIIDRLCLTAFERIPLIDTHGRKETFEFSDPQDITAFMRRPT